jgi:hypothetical protein
MLPRTIDGMKHVCYFRHALALDERRVKFLPEYAYGGTAVKEDKNNVPQFKSEDPPAVNHGPPDENIPTVGDGSDKADVPPSKNEEPLIDVPASTDNAPLTRNKDAAKRLQVRADTTEKRPHTMEVWFAGTHSDM